jgi:hypothetical protein
MPHTKRDLSRRNWQMESQIPGFRVHRKLFHTVALALGAKCARSGPRADFGAHTKYWRKVLPLSPRVLSNDFKCLPYPSMLMTSMIYNHLYNYHGNNRPGPSLHKSADRGDCSEQSSEVKLRDPFAGRRLMAWMLAAFAALALLLAMIGPCNSKPLLRGV